MSMKVSWKGEGLEFIGTADSGGEVELASSLDEEIVALTPMELLGISLAGCTAMDVLSILKKKKQEVKDFEVKVDVKRAEEYPRVWTWAQVEYIITGNDINSKAVERAINLSSEKYCSVQNMLNKAVDIELTFKIIEV
jgi:putative redox protein